MDDYLLYWQLRERVFQLNEAGSNIFLTDDLSTVLKRLKYFTNMGGQLLVLDGDKGAGKATLSSHFQGSLSPLKFEIINTYLIDSHQDTNWLSRAFHDRFGEAPKAESVSEVFAYFLKEVKDEERQVLLVVHHPEVLRSAKAASDFIALRNLPDHLLRTLTVMMIIDGDASSQNNHLIKPESIHYRATIKPWTTAQTTSFIHQRLKAAGLDSDLISPRAINLLSILTSNLPARICSLAEHCLMEAYLENVRFIDEKILHRAASYDSVEHNIEVIMQNTFTQTAATISFKDLMLTKKGSI